MSQLVVDASVALKWVIDEPGSDAAAALHGSSLSAPDLMPVECANVLWVKARKRELDPEEALERIALLVDAPVALVPGMELIDSAARLALEIDHPVYDCLYLALALRSRVPLVTADRKLVAAVRRHGRHGGSVRPLTE